MRYVVALEDPAAAEVGRVGGKVAGLKVLARLGLAVPRTAALTTEAFDRFLVHADLAAERASLLDDLAGPGGHERLEARCAALAARVRASRLPDDVTAELRETARSLGPALAVRSSATSEDARASAFAGVYHSELDVRADDVAAAVLACYAHAFTFAAVTHALAKDTDPAGIKVALVVQEMVRAETSGVFFTRDPSGADPDGAIVAFGSGQGAALMQGEVAGTSLRLSRAGARATDARLARLQDLIAPIERAFGHPQDIEWADAGGVLVFLQSRPITTLEGERPGITWTRELTEERFPKPISPLGWSILQGVLGVNTETLAKRFGLVAKRPDHVARTIRHYVYSNERFFSIPGSLRPNPLAHLRFAPGYLLEALRFGFLLPAAIAHRQVGAKLLLFSSIARAAIFPHAREVARSWSHHLAELIEEMDAFNAVDPAALSDEALWRHREDMEVVGRRYMEPDLAVYVVKIACIWVLGKIGERLHGPSSEAFLTELTAGLEDNITLRMSRGLEELYDALAKDPERIERLRAERYDDVLASLDAEATAALERFVHANGHTTTNWDIRQPTWGEYPVTILQLLRSYAVSPERRTIAGAQGSQSERRVAAREAAGRALRGSVLSSFFEELVDTLHEFMRIDEEHHFYASRLYRPVRRLYLEIGRRLVERRVLVEVDDVFFLDLDEIARAMKPPYFSRRYLIEARRASYARAAGARPPDKFLDQAPVVPAALTDGLGDGVYRGVAASPGVAHGVVRIVEDPGEVGAFCPGEVLVTVSPNPAWTPVYAVASALVTSTGSILSHGLVSAREYRLPAVIGIADVTRRLKNGQKVRVDGDTGTVSLDTSEVQCLIK